MMSRQDPRPSPRSRSRTPRAGSVLLAALLAAAVGTALPPLALATPPSVSIAQYPLTVAVPAHPQVLFAVTNSESMDGNFSGAIMTGSGGLGGTDASGLANSSSPAQYQIPSGFTPPVDPGAGGYAPYTVTVAGHQVDNSDSRMNVAKAGIEQILTDYMEYADFALMDFTGASGPWTTSVYYMSAPGGFTFTDTPGTSPYVNNPCYGANLAAADAYDQSCEALRTSLFPIGTGLIAKQYMIIGSTGIAGDTIGTTSDNPTINDVFYGGTPPVCVVWGGPTPATPYPPNRTLAQYENGGITVGYNNSTQGGCPTATGPTNAGYVPYSTQVMYALRGWSFLAAASATTGNLVVGMQSAGALPTPTSVTNAIDAFNTALAPETNGATNEMRSVALQSPIAGLLAGAKQYFQTVNPASNNGCSPTRYVVLVTDGLPTQDLANHNWPPLGSISASTTGYNVWATFNTDGSLNATNDQALTDTITKLQALLGSNIKTYVIGLGAGVDPAYNSEAAATLTAMAVAGGTNNYFPASSPTDLSNDMQVILAQILAETSATSSAAVNSTGISTTSVAYQGTFTTSDTYQDWTGNLLAYPINPQTGYINTAYTAAQWQAQTQLDMQSASSRLIATWDPVAQAGTPFEWTPGTTATSGIASSTMLGAELQTWSGDTNGQDVLNYLRGDSSKELRNGGVFRSRTHLLGDIVDSSPLFVGPPQGPWQQSSYLSFEEQYAHRQPMIYVGANDGMLHAFDVTTGNEVFAYIPNGVYSNLVKLANPYYNPQHQFFVDGSPQAADVPFSNGVWHTVLFGSERAGGKSVFALDVTDPSIFTSETAVAGAALWEFTDTDMGYSYSMPVAVNTPAGFAVVFGNGYDSTNGKPFLYVLNPQTGQTTLKMDLCAQVPTACNLTQANGLASVVAMNTSGALLSGTSNVLYAGDLQGNLWRVDISSTSPAAWTASVLFQARDSLGNAQPITVTPAVTLNPLAPTLTGTMVYFGTGEFLGVPDLGNTNTQTVYGVYDNGTAPSTPLTRANLQVQTLTSATVMTTMGVSTTIRQLSSNPVNLPSVKGWYVDLPNSGERVVTDPTLFNGTLQVTTYQPNASTCVGGGNAFYMVFNYATGGATVSPQFDWNGQNTINNADLYNGQTVAGVSLGTAYAAAPRMVTTVGGEAVVYTTSGGSELGGGGTPGTCTSVAGTNTCIPNWTNADSINRGAWQEIR